MEGTLSLGQKRLAAILRVAVGTIFLTAGVQKAFLSAEAFDATGFLKFATGGTPILGSPVEGVIYNPTNEFWVNLAANTAVMPIVNWLVVFGQLAIGVALILGIGTRFAAAMGTLMMLFFFVAAWEFEHGIVNQHLTYALVTAFIGYIGAGRYYGLDGVIEKIALVRHQPRLRYVLG
jgi:thiosulfate dehydrogenase [quinone] large subunit